jgi:PAS domain S-box-containing protein
MCDDAPDQAAHLREQLALLQKENDHLRHQLAQTEETLRSSQERFQSIIEKTPAGVCITNENYIYEYVNPAYCTLYQYDAEELIGQSFMVVVPEAYREAMANLHDRFLQGEAEVRGEWAVVTRDRTQLTILADAARIIGADGQPKKATFVTDITARKQAEDAVRRKNAYLSALNDITVGLLQRLDLDDLLRGAVTQASVLVGTTHGYIYLLEQASRMMRLRIGIGVHAGTPDYPVERGTGVAGMVWQSGKMVIVNDYPAWAGRPAAFAETHVRATVGMPLTSGREVVGVIGLTHTAEGRTFSDDEIDVLKRFASLASIAIDNVRLLNMVQQEVDERTRAEAALRAAQQAAEAANQAKSVFLSRMSHELRTPLNIILGFVQVMERDTSLSPGQQTNLATVRRSGTHLLSLINAVLELSKIEAGRETLDERSFDLHHMLDGLEEMFRIRAEQKELRLIFERTPDVPRYVVCDEGKLRQVLINLLSNAIKFTPEGGVTLAVEGRKSRTANQAESPGISMLRFVVEDTGVGIAADELPAIFEEFGQTQSGRQSNEGTGLGMSISRAFVRMLGGDIAVESAPGQGSRFSFAIPVGQGDPTRIAPQPSPRTVVALAPDQPVYRILVADDIEENRLVLQQLLTSVGFEVREASNGREVLNLWETWEPHLIWMDMRMPEMDGYEATRRIKATPRGRQTPIIALTASAFEEDRAAMREAGCNDIVAKPFEEPQIFERMAHFLGVRFVYKEEGQRDEAEDATSKLRRTVSLTPATLAALPAEWRAALAQAAEQGDEEQVVILLEQIREPHPDLAAALMTLVHTMYIDQIATLLAEGMAEQPTTGVET